MGGGDDEIWHDKDESDDKDSAKAETQDVEASDTADNVKAEIQVNPFGGTPMAGVNATNDLGEESEDSAKSSGEPVFCEPNFNPKASKQHQDRHSITNHRSIQNGGHGLFQSFWVKIRLAKYRRSTSRSTCAGCSCALVLLVIVASLLSRF